MAEPDERLEKMTMMDDTFFSLAFREDPKYIHEVIRKIFRELEFPAVNTIGKVSHSGSFTRCQVEKHALTCWQPTSGVP